ncbi:MAG: lasso RiPP family leader peptide-containing protein [Xanthomonadales bacterium]|nr:lasso RiPP family leader peptide-containing protein [Xanthomonadales bacterium]
MSAASNDIAGSSTQVEHRLAYSAPRLVELGELRDLTLGGSPGGGDSGATGTQNPFG